MRVTYVGHAPSVDVPCGSHWHVAPHGEAVDICPATAKGLLQQKTWVAAPAKPTNNDRKGDK